MAYNTFRTGIDSAAQNDYWKNQYQREADVASDSSYDNYEPKYRAGYEGYGKYGGRKFDGIENELKAD